MSIFFLFLFCLSFIGYSIGYAQCSDAGVCSLAHTTTTVPGDSNHTQHSVGIYYIFGKGAKEDSLSYHTLRLELRYALMKDLHLSLQLPYSTQRGPLGSISGLGDAILIGDYRLLTTSSIGLSVSAGARFKTGKDNVDNRPQLYQSSLGTTDVLLGVRATWENFSLTAGYQIAGGRNTNIYELQRADDLLFGLRYVYQRGAWTLTPEVLSIIRTGESSILGASVSGNPLPSYRNVPGSKQTQTNVGATIGYLLSEQWQFNMFFALPLARRPVNVDGLTRAVSMSAGVEMRF